MIIYLLCILFGIMSTSIFFLIREVRYKARTEHLFNELLEFRDEMYDFASELTEENVGYIDEMYENYENFKNELYEILVEDSDIDEDKIDKLYEKKDDKPTLDTDAILDKISKNGFDKLTSEEKEFLKKGKK